MAQEKFRKTYLESINRFHILSRERLKKRCKRYNVTFKKKKIKSINKVKYYEQGELIQVLTKVEVE